MLRPDEDSTSTQRYIDSRTVQLKSKGGWISVEVTETVKDWVSDPENNLGLKLGVHCPCCTFVPSTNNIVPNKSEELEALFAGRSPPLPPEGSKTQRVKMKSFRIAPGSHGNKKRPGRKSLHRGRRNGAVLSKVVDPSCAAPQLIHAPPPQVWTTRGSGRSGRRGRSRVRRTSAPRRRTSS